MKHWNFQPNPGGPKLFATTYQASEPQAVLFFHHGIAEHAARYHAVFQIFCENNIIVHTYDMRGHGKSEENPKQRVKISNFNDIVEDFILLCQQKRSEPAMSSLPMFIGGHSMGGLVAAHAALMHQDWFNGLLTLSPALDVEKNLILKIQSMLGAPIQMVAPWAKLVPAVRVEDMSEDPTVLEEYINDCLIDHGNIRVKTARQVEAGMNRLKPKYNQFVIPVYGHHGEDDRCTSLKAHKAFMDSISSSDKTLNLISGGYHELLMGPQKEDCAASIIEWIKNHCSGTQIKAPL